MTAMIPEIVITFPKVMSMMGYRKIVNCGMKAQNVHVHG